MNDQYNEGFSAYTEGMDYSDNPYPAGSARNTNWADGWTEAASEEDEDGDFFGSEEDDGLARYEDWR